jgi:sugar (pentulose or hexulose) kinase
LGASKPAYIGVDVGTSGVRAIAIDAAEREIATAAVKLDPSSKGPDGQSEQLPENWWNAVLLVLRTLTAQLTGHTPRALALDATSATLWLADAQGQPLTPALMYDDARSVDSLPRLCALAPADAAVHSATASLPKLLHLLPPLRGKPGLLALHQADWLLGKLTGQFGISDENNGLKLGYDAALRQWPTWLEQLDLPAGLLPRVYPAGTVIAPISQQAARLTGLPEDCLIATGTTDSTAAAIAAGIREPGEAATSLGSTLVLKVLAEKPIVDAASGVYSHRLGDLWLAGGASNSGGAVLAAFFSAEQIKTLSQQIDPSTRTGLDYYPLLKPGERFPFNDPNWPARLTPRPNTDVEFLHGLLEGIAQIERRGYERLQELGSPAPKIVYSLGGGAGNETWTAIR